MGIVICIPGLGQPLIKGLQMFPCAHALRLIVSSAAIANTIFFIYMLSFIISVMSSGFRSI